MRLAVEQHIVSVLTSRRTYTVTSLDSLMDNLQNNMEQKSKGGRGQGNYSTATLLAIT